MSLIRAVRTGVSSGSFALIETYRRLARMHV